jgi:hypothetical protein
MVVGAGAVVVVGAGVAGVTAALAGTDELVDADEAAEPTVEAAGAWAVVVGAEEIVGLVAMEAAAALVFAAVAVRADTTLRSSASVAVSFASVLALRAFWRATYRGTVVVVVVVTTGIVEPTKALANPAPKTATEVTTMVGSTRRRIFERWSVVEVRVRLAARR